VEKVTKHCSSYFSVCVQDYKNKWKIASDSLHDFDLVSENNGVLLSMMHSQGMQFKESGEGFTSVSIFGQNSQAYKDTKDGLTRVITGTNNGKDSLIILLTSEKDFSANEAKEIIGSIKTK